MFSIANEETLSAHSFRNIRWSRACTFGRLFSRNGGCRAAVCVHERLVAALAAVLFVTTAAAQGPNDSGTYYEAASGFSGSSLKTALHEIIADPDVVTYKELWDCFYESDVRDDGKVWDMYSNATNYEFGTDQGLNYKAEGDTYNREHTLPQSWFSGASPMYTDLTHIIPADGYVNGRRSNYPFGETDSPTYSSDNGFSNLGPSSISDYAGTVFEPADEYKGDFARIYFYMATCYEDKISTWEGDIFDGTSYPAYAEWVIDMFLRWSEDDAVSQKELDRNEVVYQKQGNRNPYVDYPGLEQYVWGDMQDAVFSYDNYTSATGISRLEVENSEFVDVYTLTGVAVYKGADAQESLSGLAKGIYIINGRKFVVK